MFRRLRLFIPFIITALFLSACTNETATEKPAASAKPSTAQITPAYEPNFGDTETIGDLQYTFISMSVEGDVGSGDHMITAENQFYSVLMTIKNIGDQPVAVDPSFFTLISWPNEYPVSETATLYKNDYEAEEDPVRDPLREQFAEGVPRGTLLTTLEPGEEKNGYLIFDINPTEAFITEEEGPPKVEKLEIKSNRPENDTLLFYFY